MLALGIVSPYQPEANRTLSGGLGIVPDDFEMGRQYGWYTPVQHGWINGRERWWPGGNLGNGTATFVTGRNLGDAGTAAAFITTKAGADTHLMLRELVKAERLKATMAVISGVAIAVTASIAIVRAVSTKGEKF